MRRIASAVRLREVLLATSGVFLLCFLLGFLSMGQIQTDAFSESQALGDAIAISQGQSRFGIVGYCHFPNGPIYALVPLVLMGFPDESLRMLPMIFSSLSFAFLFFQAYRMTASLATRIWLVPGAIVFLFQPAFYQWQGALHEHSWALSFTLLSLAVCLGASSTGTSPDPEREKRALLALGAVGFLSGWIGYDFLPGQSVAVAVACCLVSARVKEAILRTGAFGTGLVLAVVTHVAQNSLYFGSVSAAINDLFGSAATRMNLEAGQQLSPEYYHTIVDLSPKVSHGEAAMGVFNVFFERQWVSPSLLWIGVALWIATMGIPLFRRGLPRLARVRAGAWMVAATLATFAAGIAWSFLMPLHAVHHHHFLPRHLLVSLALLYVMPTLVSIRNALDARAG
jgi:hypothetical protein